MFLVVFNFLLSFLQFFLVICIDQLLVVKLSLEQQVLLRVLNDRDAGLGLLLVLVEHVEAGDGTVKAAGEQTLIVVRET